MKATAIPSAATNFADLPDEGRVSIQVVAIVTGRSKASIWRDVAAGRLPAPVKAGPRCTRWVVGDLRRHLAGTTSQTQAAAHEGQKAA